MGADMPASMKPGATALTLNAQRAPFKRLELRQTGNRGFGRGIDPHVRRRVDRVDRTHVDNDAAALRLPSIGQQIARS